MQHLALPFALAGSYQESHHVGRSPSSAVAFRPDGFPIFGRPPRVRGRCCKRALARRRPQRAIMVLQPQEERKEEGRVTSKPRPQREAVIRQIPSPTPGATQHATPTTRGRVSHSFGTFTYLLQHCPRCGRGKNTRECGRGKNTRECGRGKNTRELESIPFVEAVQSSSLE